MLKKNVWIAVLLIAALAFVFVGCQDRPDSGDGPEEIETNSLMINTNSINWGGGVDLRDSFFNFAAGDEITVTGYMHTSSVPSIVRVNLKPGAGQFDILRIGSQAGGQKFAMNSHVLLGTEITEMAAVTGNTKGIRIEAAAPNAKLVITEIIVKQPSRTWKLSEHLDGLDIGPIKHDDTSLFDVAKGFMDASGNGAVTYEIIPGVTALPCINEECRCLDCNSRCKCILPGQEECFSTKPELNELGNPTGNIIVGCCFVEDIYDEVDFTEAGYNASTSSFFLNLNDYKQVGATSPADLPTKDLTVECPKCNGFETGSCNDSQKANHVLQPERIKLNFTANNQRVIFKLADWQSTILAGAGTVRIEIDGEAYVTGAETYTASATPFRFHIGNAKAQNNWNAIDFPDVSGTIHASGQGLFEDIQDMIFPFNSNKNEETLQYLILQQRGTANTTVEISSIKISVNSAFVLDGLPIVLAAPKSGATAQTFVRGNGFTGEVTWYPTLANGKFAPNTTYFADILITTLPGVYIMGNGSMVNGEPAFYNAASQSVMTALFDVTGNTVNEADIMDGENDGAVKFKFTPVAGAKSLYSLMGKTALASPVQPVLGEAPDAGSVDIVAGGVSIVRVANWHGLNLLINVLPVSPMTNRIKLTVFGIVNNNAGTVGNVRLINSAGQAVAGYDKEVDGSTFKITYEIARDFVLDNSDGQLRLASENATQGLRITLFEVEDLGMRALTPVTIKAIEGMPDVLLAGEPAPTAITANEQYEGTVTWKETTSGAAHTGNFTLGTKYTATITLDVQTANRYTLAGIAANFFTVAGATATNAAGSGVITAVYSAAVVPLACGCYCPACLTADNCDAGCAMDTCLCECCYFDIDLSKPLATTIGGGTAATGVFASGALTITFAGADHHAAIPLSTYQKNKVGAILDAGKDVKVAITYTTTASQNTRLGFRSASAGSSWQGVNLIDNVAFNGANQTMNQTFSKHGNFDSNRDTVGYFLIQARTSVDSTIVVTKITISWD